MQLYRHSGGAVFHYSQINPRRDGATAWITLNRPRELNALNHALLDELDEALGSIERDEGVRAVVIAGEGRAFCAGADLKFLQELPEDSRTEAICAFLGKATAVMSRLERLPRPVVAAVNGVATAGGLELLLCCDLVIAARGVMIGDAHANFGILPGAGSSIRLPRKIGPNRAQYLLLTGELLSAEEMQAAGLVNRIVDAAALATEAAALAATLSRKSPLGLRRMKELAACALDGPLQAGLSREQLANAAHVRSFDFAEGLAAFNERRKPDFRGC
jgi:enoyl-CoA hydratase